jgi:integrase
MSTIDHAAIGFCRALVDGPTGPVLGPTKNRRTCRVALDPTSVELLVAHRDGATRTDGVVDGFVFSRDDGRNPWRPNWVTKRFIAYRHRAGLAAFRLHDLRHFMATTTLAAGVPVPVVSERLCHARTSTTVNIYAHAMPGGDRAAAVNLLAELLTPAPDRAAGPLAPTSRRGLAPQP